ncbi:MAG: NUDIX domain-containing protein [Syntrophothermus sp.]
MLDDTIQELSIETGKKPGNGSNSLPDFQISGSMTLDEIFARFFGQSEIKNINHFSDLVHFFISKYRSTKYIGVGVGGVLIYENKVLLYERDKDPEKGCLSMPGGGVLINERIENALVREFGNITGVDINTKDLRLLRITNHIYNPANRENNYHYLSPAFLITVTKSIEDQIEKENFNSGNFFTHEFEEEKIKRVGVGNYKLRWISLDEIRDKKSKPPKLTQPTSRALASFEAYEDIKAKVINHWGSGIDELLRENYG